MSTLTLRNDAARSRYEALLDGQVAGHVEYKLRPDSIELTHTEVSPDYEGKGVGSFLARETLADVKAQGKSVIPSCTFIASYLRKHPELG